MAKRLIPIFIIMALVLMAATITAQQMGLEQEAEDKRFEANELLSELNSREWTSETAMDYLGQANDAFSEGMIYYDEQSWQDAINSFDDAMYLGGEAVAYEEAGDIIDEQLDIGIPWGGEIDIESIGQGVSSEDLSILMGIIFLSIFVIMPVTYKLV